MRFLLARIVIPGILTLGGLAIAVILVALSGEAERQAPPPRVPTVEVVRVVPREGPLTIEANGVVAAARTVRVIPEVAGAVVWTSPRLRPGGRFGRGDPLARIDATAYEAALAAAEAGLAQARVERALEAGRGVVARQEWAMLREGREPTSAPLALRDPQRAAVEASVVAAEAAVARARRDLENTVIRAPFDAVVLDEALDVGQVVGPGGPVATLAGTGRVRVTVDLRLDDLARIDIPGRNAEVGAAAVVVQEMGTSEPIVREGVVVELLGQLDPQTRRARVLVEVPDADRPGSLPLIPGAFVDVAIRGRPVDGGLEVPRAAVRDGDVAWVVDEDGTLARRSLRVVWGDDGVVVVDRGLAVGERVVTSPLPYPAEGMAVEVVAEPARAGGG